MRSTPLSLQSILTALDLDAAFLPLLEERINIITHKLKFITDEDKPRVLFLADVGPVQPIKDAYLEVVSQIAGGIPINIPAGVPTADVIVIISEKSIPQLLTALPTMLALPEWVQTTAVTQGNVYIIHHPDHLRQPGALIADDIEILAEIFHKKQFFFGRDDDAWMKFEGY